MEWQLSPLVSIFLDFFFLFRNRKKLICSVLFSAVFTELYSYLANMNCSPLTAEEINEMDRIESDESDEDTAVIAEKIRSGCFGEDLGMQQMETEEVLDKVRS